MMTVEAVERGIAPGAPGTTARDTSGLALSATLHVGMLLLICSAAGLFHTRRREERPRVDW
jgi:hypothetical protein